MFRTLVCPQNCCRESPTAAPGALLGEPITRRRRLRYRTPSCPVYAIPCTLFPWRLRYYGKTPTSPPRAFFDARAGLAVQ